MKLLKKQNWLGYIYSGRILDEAKSLLQSLCRGWGAAVFTMAFVASGCGSGGGAGSSSSAPANNGATPNLNQSLVQSGKSYRAMDSGGYTYCNDSSGSWQCAVNLGSYATICQSAGEALSRFDIVDGSNIQIWLLNTGYRIAPGSSEPYTLSGDTLSVFVRNPSVTMDLFSYGNGQVIARFGGSNACAILYTEF